MPDPYNTAEVEVGSLDWEPNDEDITVTGRFRTALRANSDGIQPSRRLDDEPSGFYRALCEQDFAAIEMRVLAHYEGRSDVGPGQGGVPQKRSMGDLYGSGTSTGRISGRVLNDSNFQERSKK